MDHVADDLGRVLLTGAGGYLGRRVLERISARGIACAPTTLNGTVGEACDLTDADSVRALLDRTEPSVVIHCAAIVPTSAAAYGDTAAADASVAMLKTVADHARCPIVMASSMTVYGASPACPVREESEESPAPGYALGKWTAEQTLFGRRRAGDVAVRLPGLFGFPRRAGILYTAARAFLTGGRFELAVPSGPWAAMAVDDAAECLVRAATTRSAAAAQAVNAGYQGEFSLSSAVNEMAILCGVAWRPPSTTSQTFSMNLDRFQSRYGLLAVTFRQRLSEFVDAIRHAEFS